MYDKHKNVLYWLKGESRQNFGDYITQFLLEFALLEPRKEARGYRLIGSAIEDGIICSDFKELEDNSGVLVYWGCGMRDDKPISLKLLKHCRFYGVRGPYTRDLLGLDSSTVIGDPGLLMPLLHNPSISQLTLGKTLCIPHFNEKKPDNQILSETGAEIVLRPAISPSFEALRKIFDHIASADFILAGSLHAAIIACAYGRPFAFWDSGHLDVPFKWRDFAASISIPPAFVSNLNEGKIIYKYIIKPKIRMPLLYPILKICPFIVCPSLLLQALQYDKSNIYDSEVEAIKATDFDKLKDVLQPADILHYIEASQEIMWNKEDEVLTLHNEALLLRQQLGQHQRLEKELQKLEEKFQKLEEKLIIQFAEIEYKRSFKCFLHHIVNKTIRFSKLKF